MINKALKIHDDLLQLKEVQNYLNLKKILDNDENIQLLLKQIKQLQKQLKESVNNDYSSYLRNKKELEKKKKLFFDNPLIINYLQAQKECIDIFEQINEILKYVLILIVNFLLFLTQTVKIRNLLYISTYFFHIFLRRD